MAASITGLWEEAELAGLKANYDLGSGIGDAQSKYNPAPGTGRTGFLPVPPNNYPFYNDDEKYVPVMQADGGQLSEWKPMYHPTPEQAEADRRAAYEAGVPHGFVAPGDAYKGLPTIKLWVMSELHTDDEYGADRGPDGRHSGGPFDIEVSPKMRVEELRKVIRDKGGIIPALQKLSYAGKNLDDAQRTLEQYGVAYWHGKFPEWPLKIRRCRMSAPVSLALRAPVLGSRIGGLYSLQPQMRLAAAARQQHTPLGGRGTRLLVAAASKGFGQAAQQPKKKREEDGPVVPGQREERVKAVKFKGKRQMRGGPQSQVAQQAAANAQPGFNVLPAGEDAEPRENLVDAIEFEQRLKALKAESEAARAGGVLDAGRRGGSIVAEEDDIYANVQPLTKTLLPQDDSPSAKEYEGFRISQSALAVAAVLLGAVFLLTSGGFDGPPAGRPAAVQQAPGARNTLGEEQRAEAEARLAEVQQQLAANSGDLEAVEGAAVLNAMLGNFGEAEGLLTKLAAAQPGDADVLRVLAESQAAQGKFGDAAGSYRKAWQAGGQSSLDVLQGLAGVLIADGKESAAADAVQAARAAGGSSGIGATELALLAGKTYAQWRGHAPDAVAIYDSLIESNPDDFRAYLAKGLVLRDQGREGDATRYFIQAKFFAKENRQLVEQIIAAREAQQ